MSVNKFTSFEIHGMKKKKKENKSEINENAAQFHFKNFVTFSNTVKVYKHILRSSETEVQWLRLLILFINLNITKKEWQIWKCFRVYNL